MSTRVRERTAKKLQNKDRRPMAVAKYIRIPSSKVKLVLNVVRGKSYGEAVSILKNMNKSSSPVILKLLESAVANAENNLSMMKDNLFIAECWATAAPTMKRMMPRARGRADRILKRTSHITMILDELKKDTKKVAKKEVKKAEPKKVEVKKEVKKVVSKSAPVTKAEKPLADKPNTAKPLGTKKVATAAKTATTKSATTKSTVKKEAK